MQTPARIASAITLTIAVVVFGASGASADEPVGWADGEQFSSLDVLLIYVGAPIALFVGITVFALVTARKNYVPPPPSKEVIPTVDH